MSGTKWGLEFEGSGIILFVPITGLTVTAEYKFTVKKDMHG